MQSETESLLEKERRPSLEADPTLQHSSPKQEPPLLGPRGSYSAWGFFRSRPGGSFHSLRRVSSLDNFEAARSEFQRKFRERRANSGRGKTPELSVLLREPRSRAMAPARLGGEVSYLALLFSSAGLFSPKPAGLHVIPCIGRSCSLGRAIRGVVCEM